MAVVQPVNLARHEGGAVHILVIVSFHGVRTCVVLWDHVTSEDARPWPLENNALTTVVSSSIRILYGRGAGGEGGMGDLGLRCWLAVWEVCAGSVDASARVLGLQTAAGAVYWRLLSFCPDICAGYLPCGVLFGSSAVPPVA